MKYDKYQIKIYFDRQTICAHLSQDIRILYAEQNNEVCSDKLCTQCTNKVGKRKHEVDRFE